MDATGITIPFDVEEVFGAKRVPVKVLVNGAEHRSTIVRMSGKYMMCVPKRFRDAAGVNAGEIIEVTMERDAEKRTVEVPEYLTDILKKANLQDIFSKMSFTDQKEYINAINEAKKEETRIKRIEKFVKILNEKNEK